MKNKIRGKVAIPLYNNRDCGQILSVDQINDAAKNLKNYGIDKLAITFKYGEEFAYHKEQIPHTWSKQETTNPTGEIKRKYYKNHINFNATIQTFDVVNEDYLTIQFNPSKIVHPFKLITDTAIIADELVSIQKDLKSNGIELDYEKAKVTRLDVAHNINLNYPLNSYSNVFDSYQGKRQIKKVHDDTRYWGNKENQFTIYDKMKELMNRDLGDMPPSQICRGEMRLLNKDCVKRIFNSNSLGNIISDEELYVDVFNGYVKDKIFRENQLTNVQIDFGELYQLYEKLYFQYGNKAFQYALKSLGIHSLAEQPNGVENFIAVLKKYHNERTARRHIVELNNLLNLYKISFPQKTKTFIEQNQEVKEKLIIKPNYLIAV